MAQDALFSDQPTRRSGPVRAAVERTIKAWRDDGHMVGPAWAAASRVLRDSADAVDAAASAMRLRRCDACGKPVPGAWIGAPGTLAYVNNIHAQLLAQHRPVQDAAGADPYGASTDDDALAAAVAAALAGDDTPPPVDAD